MKKLMHLVLGVLLIVTLGAADGGCESDPPKNSDTAQQQQQETILAEATSSVGMPSIHNFRERRILKDILEMRDQEILTYTYLYSDMTSKLTFFCDSVGYGLPYATEYTSPQKVLKYPSVHENQWVTIPQADPNGLFSPTSAEGTWILCKDPGSKDTKPVYVEPRVVVSPFKLKEE